MKELKEKRKTLSLLIDPRVIRSGAWPIVTDMKNDELNRKTEKSRPYGS